MTRFRILLMLVLFCMTPLAHADCRALATSLQTASKAGDLQALEQLAEQIPLEPTCVDTYRNKLSRVAAYGFLREIQKRLGAGEPLSQQQALLERSLQIARTWQALAMLGDLQQERKDYAEASLAYQEALNLIDDPALTERPPSPADIQGIYQKASECRALAEHYVKAPTNHRSGAAGGLAMTSVRGWAVEKVPVPVTFKANTAAFTHKGQEAVADLAVMLRRDQPPRITLIGHTDERGAEDVNLYLSQQRAEAVAEYLRENGYHGQIQVEGAGESQPAALYDPSRYTKEEIWALNRRVEMLRQ